MRLRFQIFCSILKPIHRQFQLYLSFKEADCNSCYILFFHRNTFRIEFQLVLYFSSVIPSIPSNLFCITKDHNFSINKSLFYLSLIHELVVDYDSVLHKDFKNALQTFKCSINCDVGITLLLHNGRLNSLSKMFTKVVTFLVFN